MKKVLTLCLIINQDKILLGYKKRGFGAGRWNGFGGKVEAGESVEQAATRELYEEAGVEALDLQKRGVITFVYQNSKEELAVHVFSAIRFSGNPKETPEMKPQWFALDQIPYNQMWPDDQYWLPELLAGKNFSATFLFSDYDNILSHQLEILD